MMIVRGTKEEQTYKATIPARHYRPREADLVANLTVFGITSVKQVVPQEPTHTRHKDCPQYRKTFAVREVSNRRRFDILGM